MTDVAIPPSPGGYWRSGSAFVFAAIAATVGVGVVLRLPVLAQQYGGGAFLLVYVLALGFAAWPLLSAELMLGRLLRQDLTGGLSGDIRKRDLTRGWLLMAGFCLLVPLLVVSYYAVIAGWNAAFFIRALSNNLLPLQADDAAAPFLALAQDAERSMAWHTLMVVASGVIVARGLRGGMEQFSRALLLVALLLVFFLAVMAGRGAGLDAALAIWLSWDWSALGWRGVSEAIRQALFSAGIGLGMMLALGAFLPERGRVLRLSALTLLGATVFALVAGSLIIGLVKSVGLTAGGQMPTLFVALVQYATTQDARWVPAAVYLMMTLLALASMVALMEPLVQFVMGRKRCTRVYAVGVVGAAVWAVGLCTVLTFGSALFSDIGGKSLFGWMQTLSLQWGAPLAILSISLYVGRVWSRAQLSIAMGARLKNDETRRVGRRALSLRFLLVYPARMAAIFTLLYGIGVVDWVVGFWSVAS
ncbi:MAG: sodium-dependent transporter [Algiphilus sp.]